MKIHRRSFIGVSAVTLLASRTVEAQLVPPAREAPGGGPIGYAAVVTMDAGPVYTYNPDAPDAHTTVTVQENFVSDFAGFTQGSVHVRRDDTALRIYFRKDASPDPARIEVILELGHFTTGNKAADLGPFTLQILKAGVAQPIPTPTLAKPSLTSTAAHFPSMGWWTRWRWNPTPRRVVRTGSQLLPSGLNLVPNFSAALAQRYGAVDCGKSGGPPVVTAYSSAYAPGAGNDKNPVGVNEQTVVASYMSGVGGRPDIGIVPEWNANWIVNGNGNALTTMLKLAEVDGGIPWCYRDSSTGWAPINFYRTPLLQYDRHEFDAPKVTVPSNGYTWQPEVYHHPMLSYVPYLITGDPFFLENLQFVASWAVAINAYHRKLGFQVNYADPKSPTTPGFPQAFPGWRFQSRGFAWTIRDYVACYLATPASTPSWLLPKSYFRDVLLKNAQEAEEWGPNYPTAHSDLRQYPGLHAQGMLSAAASIEESFQVDFLIFALGFAVSQGGLTQWLPYFNYVAKLPIAWLNGTSGWDNRFPALYQYHTQAFSTDYNGSPSEWRNFADAWAWHRDNAVLLGSDAWATTQGASQFRPWAPNALYRCNSWIFEMRSGMPSPPSVGDVVRITIDGPFAGSPVTLSHTVTSGDITAIANAAGGLRTGSSGPNPVTDDLIAQINANAKLSAGGITAALKPTVPGMGDRGSGAFFTAAASGRIYISFDSTRPASAFITVTGSFKTASAGSLYIAPNGDGVTHGNASFNPYRVINYQCGKTGTSGDSTGPTGTALQTLVAEGTTNWCFTPELKSTPLTTPGAGSAVFPQYGYGGSWPSTPFSAGYAIYQWTAANVMTFAGLAGASAAQAKAQQLIDYIFTHRIHGTNWFNASIAS